VAASTNSDRSTSSNVFTLNTACRIPSIMHVTIGIAPHSGKHENPRSLFQTDIASPAICRQSAGKIGHLDGRSRPPTATNADGDSRPGTRPLECDSNISTMTASVDAAAEDRVVHLSGLAHAFCQCPR
jgi:hypothetical protein